MQARTAIVLPLGLLFESVNVAPFIATLMHKAKTIDPDFVFTKQLQVKAFELAEQYNKNVLSGPGFQNQILESLGIVGMEDAEFRAAWNQMIEIGNVAEKVSQLRDILARENAILFLVSDTNVEHLMTIERGCPDLFAVQINDSLQRFADFPLYTSCHFRENRMALIQLVVGEIEKLQFNKPNDVKVVLGNPANVVNVDQRVFVQAECDAIKAWAAQNNVGVVLHDKDRTIVETLGQIFAPVNVAERTRSAMSLG
jgi:hypothetical protein